MIRALWWLQFFGVTMTLVAEDIHERYPTTFIVDCGTPGWAYALIVVWWTLVLVRVVAL